MFVAQKFLHSLSSHDASKTQHPWQWGGSHLWIGEHLKSPVLYKYKYTNVLGPYYTIVYFRIMLYLCIVFHSTLIYCVTTAGAFDVGRVQRPQKAVRAPAYIVFHGVQRARHGTPGQVTKTICAAMPAIYF